MNKQSKGVFKLFARYISVLILGLGNLYLFYKILTPLTVHVTNFVIMIFTETNLINTIIYLTEIGFAIEIVPACVAGSAFYLILLLIMSTADIKPEIRIKAILTSFALLFALNVLRILLLVPMATASYFETVHWVSWHFISIVFVVGVWVLIVNTYKIKSIPVYTDLKYLKSLIKTKKSKRKKKNK